MPKKTSKVVKIGKKSRHPTAKRRSLSITVKKLIKDYIYRIDLDADYQREKVWSKKDQELLLDSIIKGIDIPKLYLAEVKGNKQYDYECIDGKQRLATLWSYFEPEPDEKVGLTIEIAGYKYNYKQLKEELPTLASQLEEYQIDFVIYDQSALDAKFVREIFQRLQLGIRLNTGELLNSQMGTMRDFVFNTIGKNGPFLRNTNLSDKRYSREFTLAQICINSFHSLETGEFTRARLTDLQDFFEENSSIKNSDERLSNIKKMLKIMDREFGEHAQFISSRAVAVTAYLFSEDLVWKKKESQIKEFAEFYIKLLETIKENMDLLRKYEKPVNPKVMEGFQKYVLQASVEPYSIKRRHEFLSEAFKYYRNNKSKGKIIRK